MKNTNFYKNKKWKRIRIVALKRDSYLCQDNVRYGKRIEANYVHHIIPLDICLIENKALAYDLKNLISLSGTAHDKLHDRVNDKLTESGKALLIKTFKSYGREIINKYNL